MKTAIEELIEKITLKDTGSETFLMPTISNEVLNYLREKYKKQIKDAFNQGYRESERNNVDRTSPLDVSNFDDAENYYSQIYKNDAHEPDKCTCLKCSPQTIPNMRFIVCLICGNKRCPHALDHNNECTNSNEVGQISKKTKNENHV